MRLNFFHRPIAILLVAALLLTSSPVPSTAMMDPPDVWRMTAGAFASEALALPSGEIPGSRAYLDAVHRFARYVRACAEESLESLNTESLGRQKLSLEADNEPADHVVSGPPYLIHAHREDADGKEQEGWMVDLGRKGPRDPRIYIEPSEGPPLFSALIHPGPLAQRRLRRFLQNPDVRFLTTKKAIRAGPVLLAGVTEGAEDLYAMKNRANLDRHGLYADLASGIILRPLKGKSVRKPEDWLLARLMLDAWRRSNKSRPIPRQFLMGPTATRKDPRFLKMIAELPEDMRHYFAFLMPFPNDAARPKRAVLNITNSIEELWRSISLWTGTHHYFATDEEFALLSTSFKTKAIPGMNLVQAPIGDIHLENLEPFLSRIFNAWFSPDAPVHELLRLSPPYIAELIRRSTIRPGRYARRWALPPSEEAA